MSEEKICELCCSKMSEHTFIEWCMPGLNPITSKFKARCPTGEIVECSEPELAQYMRE